jgi:imidazolonepropionase-like amidohydrolase
VTGGLLLALAVLTHQAAAPDTLRYPVTNHGRPAGEMTVVRTHEAVEVRYGHIDRNRGRWVFSRYTLDGGGRVVGGEGGPTSRDGTPEAVQERFGDTGSDHGEAAGHQADTGPDRPFLRRFATPWEAARMARDVLAGREGSSRPGDTDEVPRAEVVRELVVPTEAGPASVRFVVMHRDEAAPSGVWLDVAGELFATEVSWFITARADAGPAMALLRSAEIEYRNEAAEAMARALAPPAAEALVIRGGDVFDSETGQVWPATTVVVRGERIVAVGPVGEVEEPEDARVFDARGKTVLPGMWDMHSHSGLVSQNEGALLQLANGLTTVRDLAADLDVAVELRDRANAGAIVSPRQVLAGFIEGPGLWAGPTEVLAGSEAEARAWVAHYDSLGYRQVKIYNLVHPDLVPAIADEARRRGLRLSGHVPRGMSVEAAVELGYDEINHAAFLFSTFFQDSLYVPEMRPYSAVAAAVAPSFDVDGAGMTRLIDFLADRGTVVDGTFNLWMGGRAILEGAADAGAEAYSRLIARLHEAGVRLVPGTDSFSGGTYLTELLLYEHAGVPAPEVLRLATLVSARVMGDDAEYGSVAPGKVADLLIVDGRPAERIADLENIDWVIRAGRVYEPRAIREALRGGR